MDSHAHVKPELDRFLELKRRIAEVEPDIDEQTLTDTVEGISDLPELLAAIVRSSLEDRSLAAAIKERVTALRDRLARIEAREEKKRAIVRDAMEEAGLTRLTDADCTVALRQAPASLSVMDEALIPEWFWVPQPSKLDRRQLLDAIKAGAHVPGAELSPATMSLSVRVR
jgi:hypothetical protein